MEQCCVPWGRDKSDLRPLSFAAITLYLGAGQAGVCILQNSPHVFCLQHQLGLAVIDDGPMIPVFIHSPTGVCYSCYPCDYYVPETILVPGNSAICKVDKKNPSIMALTF